MERCCRIKGSGGDHVGHRTDGLLRRSNGPHDHLHVRRLRSAPSWGPDTEIHAFVTAAIDVMWDSLSFVIWSTIDSSKYVLLSFLCRGACEAEEGSTYDNFVSARSGDRMLSAKAKMMMGATRAFSKVMARQLLDPAAISRNWYNMVLMNTPEGDIMAVDRANAPRQTPW